MPRDCPRRGLILAADACFFVPGARAASPEDRAAVQWRQGDA
jgi:hypothetical protein